MSRTIPETVIIGAAPQRSKIGEPIMGIIDPLRKADGKPVGHKPLLARPLFTMPAPIGTVSHWASNAARRRCGGDMTKAKPSELVQVPIYRGTSARFMNEIRGDQRRTKRKSLVQRIRSEIASRVAVLKEGFSG